MNNDHLKVPERETPDWPLRKGVGQQREMLGFICRKAGRSIEELRQKFSTVCDVDAELAALIAGGYVRYKGGSRKTWVMPTNYAFAFKAAVGLPS